jgi:hypothetical protein
MIDKQPFAIRRGDEVAIIPARGASPRQVRGLAIVAYVGPALIHLDNGRLYFVTDGQGMSDCTCIVLATDEHRAALLFLHDA